jgi:oligoribonuclease (3'-5' exoribonuclease)
VHSAAEDIDESMAELTYYLQFIDQDKVKAEVERQQKAADKNKG